eukprot:Skav206298  [mRNA]  locus=scaffold3268:130382:130882:+ [translate_table: standard]
MSDPAHSPEVKQVIEVLKKARASGVLDLALKAVAADQEPSKDAANGSKPHLSPRHALTDHQWVALEEFGRQLLPQGVGTMLKWSSTLITFGKLKDQKMSYLDLALDKSDEMQAYAKHVLDHGTSKASSQFQDLAAFLKVFRRAVDERACFPGTQVIRSFKIEQKQT